MYYLVGMLLLLGILVIIHEFGHFYVAKLCGMKVETFSIGMGKKLLSYKRGETEYAVSLIPFGGYVKILGQDPREEIAPEEQHRSFSLMPLWKRFAVVIAGPVANLILAFFVFWILFIKGFPSPSSTIQFVMPNSIAAQAGLHAGDKVIEVSTSSTTKSIRELQDFQQFMRVTNDPKIHLKVQREAQTLDFDVSTDDGKTVDALTGLERNSRVIPGVDFQNYAPIYTLNPAISKINLLKKELGGNYFFVESVEVDGQKTEMHSNYELENLLAQSKGKTLTLHARLIDLKKDVADFAEKNIPITPAANASVIVSAGFIPAHLLVTQILAASAAEKMGLKAGDLILNLNKEPMWTFMQFRERLQNLATSGKKLELDWLRDGKTMHGQFAPSYVDQENPVTEKTEKKFQLGAMFIAFGDASFEKVQSHGFFDGLKLSANKTWNMSASIVESFEYLLSGKVSIKAMGGPVMIGKIAGDSLRLGWEYFLKILAFISLNLCIFNLIPLPVLDGGHILLFAIEAIVRRPIPAKIVEAWATAGFVLLMGLALFVTFNDLHKLNFAEPIIKLFTKGSSN